MMQLNKQTLTAAIAISALLISLVGGLLDSSRAMADPMILFRKPSIAVLSPEINKIYYSPNVLLNLSFPPKTITFYFNYSNVQCFLDGKPITEVDFSNATPLENLSLGFHEVRVTADLSVQPNMDEGGWWHHVYGWEGIHQLDTGNIIFFVEEPHVISVLMGLNETYFEKAIPLVFAVNFPVSKMEYSLNAQQNISIMGNTTLTELPIGYHSIVVYVNDTEGNIAKSETVFFTISASPPPSHSPSPIPTPTLTPTASPSSSIPEFPTWILLPTAIVTASFALAIKRRKT
jgi:hypothetical protein